MYLNSALPLRASGNETVLLRSPSIHKKAARWRRHAEYKPQNRTLRTRSGSRPEIGTAPLQLASNDHMDDIDSVILLKNQSEKICATNDLNHFGVHD